MAGIGRDITALKETERELVATREAALAASRAKSEFLSSMSHEIRTPMTAILGMAELLAEGELNEEQRRYIEILNNNGYALLDLINSILDLAKVESGRLTLEHVAFDLREVVQKSAQTLALRAHAKRLELIVSVASDIPFVVMGDPLRLRQVLINLIANAIKFTDQGEVVVSVDRNCVPDDPLCLKFSVRDTGIGIAKDKLPLLFAAFAQADSSTARKYGGSGLGLAIVRRLVNLLRGEVAIESELGKGSVFSFTTQFEPRPDAPAAARWPELAEVPILIVDNNRTGREVLRRMFSDRGASDDGSRVVCCRSESQSRRRLVRDVRRVSYCLTIGSHSKDSHELAAADRSRIAVRRIDRRDDSLRQPGGRRFAAAIHEARNLPGQADRHERTCQSGSPRDHGRHRRNSTSGCSAASQRAGHLPIVDRPLKILFADDSSDNRTLIRAFLKKTPYHLDEVENGRQAIDRFIAAGDYDLVLMDIQMPEVDGFAATRAIRKWEQENDRKRTPIIALTASVFGEAVRLTQAAGCDAHVAKPIGKAALLRAIYDAVAGASQA